jgi:hypothetical protein
MVLNDNNSVWYEFLVFYVSIINEWMDEYGSLVELKGQGNPRITRRQTCSSGILSSGLVQNPGFLGTRPVTNRLNHDTTTLLRGFKMYWCDQILARVLDVSPWYTDLAISEILHCRSERR